MKYPENTLNLKVTCRDWPEQTSLPYLLTDRYRFRLASLGGGGALFVYPKWEPDPISTIKKHFDLIAKSAAVPPVLILEKCTTRQRKAAALRNVGLPCGHAAGGNRASAHL